LKDVGVDHGGLYILVSEEFLDGSYNVAVLEKVGCEGVAEGVRGNTFVYFSEEGCLSNGFLEGSFVDVVAARDAGFGISEEGDCGEDALPNPLFMSGRIFFFKSKRHID